MIWHTERSLAPGVVDEEDRDVRPAQGAEAAHHTVGQLLVHQHRPQERRVGVAVRQGRRRRSVGHDGGAGDGGRERQRPRHRGP
eukprot:1346385-Rhodomonas_salina.1